MRVGLRATSTEQVHEAHGESVHAAAALSQQLPSKCQRTAAQLALLKHARRHVYSVKPTPRAAMSLPAQLVCGYVIQSSSAMGETEADTVGELLLLADTDDEAATEAVADAEMEVTMVAERESVALSVGERESEGVRDVEESWLREMLEEREADAVAEPAREEDRVAEAEALAVELGDSDGLGSHWQHARCSCAQGASLSAPRAYALALLATAMHAPAPRGSTGPVAGVPHSVAFVALKNAVERPLAQRQADAREVVLTAVVPPIQYAPGEDASAVPQSCAAPATLLAVRLSMIDASDQPAPSA